MQKDVRKGSFAPSKRDQTTGQPTGRLTDKHDFLFMFEDTHVTFDRHLDSTRLNYSRIADLTKY